MSEEERRDLNRAQWDNRARFKRQREQALRGDRERRRQLQDKTAPLTPTGEPTRDYTDPYYPW